MKERDRTKLTSLKHHPGGYGARLPWKPRPVGCCFRGPGDEGNTICGWMTVLQSKPPESLTVLSSSHRSDYPVALDLSSGHRLVMCGSPGPSESSMSMSLGDLNTLCNMGAIRPPAPFTAPTLN